MLPEDSETFSPSTLQVFTDDAITDPAILAEYQKKSRRPRKWPRWLRPVLTVAGLLVALVLGFVLGRVVP